MSIQSKNSPAPRWPLSQSLSQSLLRLGKKSWWMTLVLWVVAIAPARAAELEMRVAIEQDVPQIQVGSSTNAVLRDVSGRELARIPAQNAVVAQASGGQVAVSEWTADAFWVEPSGDGLVWIGDRWYRGRTLVVPTAGGLTAVNYVDLEEYLYSVVGSEVYTDWNPEALKAQAVAARSYALFQRNTGANQVFDVGDTVRWQVYKGVEEEAASTTNAVEATRGQVVTHNGQIINAVFHACAGGFTEDVENVWSNRLDYLRAVPDFDLDPRAPQEFQARVMQSCSWNVTVTASQLQSIAPGIGDITSFTLENTTPQGRRVMTARIGGSNGSKTVSGTELRRALGLRSTQFSISPASTLSAGNRSAAGAIAFQITGRGFGHGLGMSQWGAQSMALQGQKYQQILQHYYTDTQLSRIEVR